MRSSALLAFLLLATSTATAQMPLPPFASTNTGNTRGFWFRAPVNFTIIGLRVPDESGHGLQNVQVFNMASLPPAYPASGTGGDVFYAAGVPSNEIIPCNISFLAGDYVGVLGACGDASTQKNSYGSGNASSLLGHSITLGRFLTQTNIVASGGINTPYSRFTLSTIARVWLYVVGISGVHEYGTGTSAGSGIPTLTSTAPPVIGTNAQLTLSHNDAANIGSAILLSFASANLPIFGGTLLVDPGANFLSQSLGALSLGATTINFPIPNHPFLVSTQWVYLQALLLVPPGISMTNGVQWLVGEY